MKVIDQLAYSLGRRDEETNIELARKISATQNKVQVKELMQLLHHKNANILSDAIKVLYEIGETDPALISEHLNEFVALLDHKNNRLVWGAMTAINAITSERPDDVYKLIPKLSAIAENASVITRDRYVYMLAKLASQKKYAVKVMPLILEQIRTCPINQCGMYAELVLPLVKGNAKTEFVGSVQLRMADAEKETTKKRLQKILKKANLS